MQIPPKCRLAVNAMMDLALRQGHGPVPLSAISARQQVSPSYLDLLFGRLRRHGLVTGTRGPGGGYTLARDAKAISVADIVDAVDEADRAATATGHRSFTNRQQPDQRIGAQWCAELEQGMLRLLADISLEDMVAPQRGLVAAASPAPARLPTAKGLRARERMVVIAANSVFARPLRLAI